MTSIEDELAIRRLLATYCHRMDDADFDGVALLFTAEGVFRFFEQSATGHAALAALFEAQQPPHRRGKHVNVNHVVDVDDDRARVVSDFLFVRRMKGGVAIEVAGRYVDALVRTDGGWLIERRDADMQLVTGGD